MRKSFKYILAGVVILVMLIVVICFANTKTFRGRVVDADTKEPLEGTVVVASWYKESWIPLGETMVKLKDVKETLTDKNGKWSIRGPSGGGTNSLSYYFAVAGVFYHTREPEFIIFKPGYCSWPNGFHIDSCKGRMDITGVKEKKLGEGGTLEVPKLASRVDRTRAQAIQEPVDEGVDGKLGQLHRLLNEERRTLGLGEINYR